MYEYMKKPSSKQYKCSVYPQRKSEISSPQISAFGARKGVVQMVRFESKTPGSNERYTIDTRVQDPKSIMDWMRGKIETQPEEVRKFIEKLSSSEEELNETENEILQYAKELWEEEHICRVTCLRDSLLEIAKDNKNYPYGGFLSEHRSLNRMTPDESPLVEELGKDEKSRNPGMNCWGAILFAAFRAGLIDKEKMLWLDRRGKDKLPRLFSEPSEELCKSMEEWEEHIFTEGCIISLADKLDFSEDIPGKHVFLSMGGIGLGTVIVEVDSKHRGQATLGAVLERYQLVGKEKIKLYIYKPEWLGF